MKPEEFLVHDQPFYFHPDSGRYYLFLVLGPPEGGWRSYRMLDFGSMGEAKAFRLAVSLLKSSYQQVSYEFVSPVDFYRAGHT